MDRDNPIFTALTLEFQRQGKDLPWIISIRPRSTIGTLPEMTKSIQPLFGNRYRRRPW